MSALKKIFIIALAFILWIVAMVILCVSGYEYLENSVLTSNIMTMLYVGCGLGFLAIFLVSTTVTNKTAKLIIKAVSYIPVIVAAGYTIVYMVS